ncbi:centrosomal protein of 162 kDa-like [Camelus ferus]|uniref:Centrosomal protein of 162 kDa-like n=1 Tax=Camelus ferus TaxID=419612 RepID=A0A8B8RJV3_CAMFR|nr:centrosomal protein of 162 kDa-like [Camelus ferus]
MTVFLVLLGSLDSVAEVSLDEQDKATAKPKAPPGVTDNETTGTGENLPMVEKLMKPIRIDSFGVGGFDLQPVSYKKLAKNKEIEYC